MAVVLTSMPHQRRHSLIHYSKCNRHFLSADLRCFRDPECLTEGNVEYCAFGFKRENFDTEEFLILNQNPVLKDLKF